MSQNQYPSTPSHPHRDQTEGYFTPSLNSLADIDPYSSMRSYKPQGFTATTGYLMAQQQNTPDAKRFDLLHGNVTPANDTGDLNAYHNYPTPSKTSRSLIKTPVFSEQSMERKFKPQADLFGSQLPTMQKPNVDAAELSKAQDTIEQLKKELQEKEEMIRDLATQNEANVTAMVLGNYTDQADSQELAHRILTRLRTLNEENAFLNTSSTVKRLIELEGEIESLKAENSVLKRASRNR